jgi:branched-chain amino acid transport system permease protein
MLMKDHKVVALPNPGGRSDTPPRDNQSVGIAQPSARRKVLPILEIFLLFVAMLLPLVLEDYLTVFATRVLILTLFALSFDLVWGYAGIMSFGQAFFFGISGYCVTLLARDLDITSVFAVLSVGTLVGLTSALLLGGFLLLGRSQVSVIFVSLGTLIASYSVERLARGWYYLGGQNGIPVTDFMTLGSYELNEGPVFYYLVLGILFMTYVLCRFIVRSQFGLVLAGLRENEQRIAFFGYKVRHLKLIVFSLGGAIAGLAGSLYSFHEGFVWPNMLGVIFSTQVVLYVLFGGTGTLIGAVLGTIVIEVASFWLSTNYMEIWPIILGVLLLLVIMFKPAGLVGFFLSERERIGDFGALAKRGPDAAS